MKTPSLQTMLIGDFETSTGNIDGSTNVYLWGLSTIDKKNRYCGVNLTEMFNTIKYYNLKDIYFHNLSWDGVFIVNWLLDNDIQFIDKKFEIPTIKNSFTWMCDNNSSIFSIIINYEGHIINIGCTLKLLLMSVDKLGKVLGKEKLTVDYDEYKFFENINKVPKKLIDYLWRDIDIVIDIYQRFRAINKSHSVTLGSTALKSFKKTYGEYNYTKNFGGKYYDRFKKETLINNVLSIEQWDEIKMSYRGGLVSYNQNYLGVHLKNLDGYSADFNSMYPSKMWEKPMPVGTPYKNKLHNNMLTLHKIFIIKANIKDTNYIPIIPSNTNNNRYEVKYLQNVENDYYTIWEFELEVWKKMYDIQYRIVDSWYFETDYVFKEWVDTIYKNKEYADNEVDKLIYKTIMNSLYGKTGQNRTRRYKILVYDPIKEFNGKRYGKDGHYVEQTEIEESAVLSYIPIASAITAYCRTTLSNVLIENFPNALYCDTDSIYSSKKLVGIKIDPVKLNHWKYETRFTEIKYIKPKSYMVMLSHEYKYNKERNLWEWKEVIDDDKRIKRVIAGLNKENHKYITFDNFYRGYEVPKGKKQKKIVKGGLILTDIKYTL